MPPGTDGIVSLMRTPSPANGNAPKDTVARSSASNQSSFSANTNLEQRSDWLTKILVGLGSLKPKEFSAT